MRSFLKTLYKIASFPLHTHRDHLRILLFKKCHLAPFDIVYIFFLKLIVSFLFPVDFNFHEGEDCITNALEEHLTLLVGTQWLFPGRINEPILSESIPSASTDTARVAMRFPAQSRARQWAPSLHMTPQRTTLLFAGNCKNIGVLQFIYAPKT